MKGLDIRWILDGLARPKDSTLCMTKWVAGGFFKVSIYFLRRE